MQALRQLGGGVIIAIVSILLVIGGISLAIAESAPAPTSYAEPFNSPTLQSIFPAFTTPATFPTNIQQTATQVVFEIQTATIFPALTQPPILSCSPPSGWFQIFVGAGENIYTLSQRYKISEDALKNANCLPSYDIQAGSVLFVPPVPTAPPIVCGPPFGWVQNYVVQPGDNLYRIALSFGISYPQLQTANCMGDSVLIYTGQRLWVPNIPTLTPLPGATAFPTLTATLMPTSTFISTATIMPTFTATLIPTASPAPTSTAVPTASNTSIPQNTLTPSLTPFPTQSH